MKLEDGMGWDENDFKNKISYLTNEYKLIVFFNDDTLSLPFEKWYTFSMNNPPHKAVEWLTGNKFIVKEKNDSAIYIISENGNLEMEKK
ncbi:hypothetical protein SDC9_166501 [bioreactor metagenome]|uniref:Uncharacterized protein n=1 Tax=bioreactor metagenome TaxID=1076179 RepID=A0A645FXG0_9ZZZZ